MARFLIYLFPAMIDMVLGSVFFVGTVRMFDSGASATVVTAVIAAWAVSYMVACPFVGRVVKPGNAASLLIATSVAMIACSAGFILIPQVGAIFVLIVLLAVATAFFFVPFQVFMKAVEHGRPQGVARSTSLYTFAWSMGMAMGPFVAGFIWDKWGWQWCYANCIVLSALMGVGVFFLKHHAHHGANAGPAATDDAARPQEAAPHADGEYSRMPDLAWLGWVACGACCVAVSMIRSVFPYVGGKLAIDKPQQGVILAIVSAVQAITGLCFLGGRKWMFRVWPFALFGAAGLAGLVLFGYFSCSDSSPNARIAGFYAAAACFGIYAGAMFFYLVFHSLIHPSKSAHYVAVNESVVGITTIIGPLAGGVLADHFTRATPYYASAIVVAAAVAVQVIVHRKHARQVALLDHKN